MSTMHPYDQPDAQPKKKSRIKKVALWVGGIFLAFALLGSCIESDDEPEAPAEPTATAEVTPAPTEAAQEGLDAGEDVGTFEPTEEETTEEETIEEEATEEETTEPEPTTEAAPEPEPEEETTEAVEEAVEDSIEFDRDTEVAILDAAMAYTFSSMSSSDMSDICWGWTMDDSMQDMMMDVFVDGVGDLDDFEYITEADVRQVAREYLNEYCG